jgi:hypothetical protein
MLNQELLNPGPDRELAQLEVLVITDAETILSYISLRQAPAFTNTAAFLPTGGLLLSLGNP